MARKSLSLFFCFFLLVFSASFAWSQTGGAPSFSAQDNHEFDSVDLTTLLPVFTFPVTNGITLKSPQGCHVIGSLQNGNWVCSFDVSSSTYPMATLAPTLSSRPVGITPFIINWSTDQNNCTTITMSGVVESDLATFHPFSTNGQGNYPSAYYPSTPACGSLPTSVTATTNDSSGLTATLSLTNATTPVFSVINAAGSKETVTGTWYQNPDIGSYTLTDPFSNTETYSGAGGSYTNKLGAIVTLGGTSGLLPTSYTYTDTTGHSQQITFTIGTSTTFKSLIPTGNSQCPQNVFTTTAHPITAINYPDGTSMGVTWQPNGSGNLSGLIQSITLRAGGTISYTYGSPVTDANCDWYYTSLQRTTPDGTYTYTLSTSSNTTTATVLDPGKNKIVYTIVGTKFGNLGLPTFLKSVYRYQNTGTVASPVYTLLSNTSYTYNNSSSNPTPPITQRDTYEYVGTGSTQMSHRVETYDSTYGLTLTDATTENTTTPNVTVTKTYVYGTWNGTTCVAITNSNIHDHPCTITTTNGATQLAKKTFTYNTNGAPTAATTWISATDSLTTNYTPNTNGTIGTVQAPNGQSTTITYGSCNSLLPTATSTTVNSVTLTTGTTWNCNGALPLTTTDYNSNVTTYTYDSMFRPSSQADPLTFTLNDSYTSTSAEVSWSMTSPSASSATYVYTDGLGRPINTQTTHGSNYDTLSAGYSFNGPDWQTQTSEPCSKTSTGSGQTCSSLVHTVLHDPLGRPEKSTTTSNETIAYTYSANDVGVELSPAPGTENTKKNHKEFNGFGRIKSDCGLLASGGTACGQSLSGSGILTVYSYSFGTGSSTITATRGSQTHTLNYDAAGRLTSETYPESGTKTYTYDSRAANYCNSGDAAYSSPGNLVATTDGASNKVCYNYDGLNRLTDVTNNHEVTNSGNTYCRRFRYDSTANALTSLPGGFISSNELGRLLEAETDTCAATLSTNSNEFFSYDADGRKLQNNAMTATYYLNGELHTYNDTGGGNPYGVYTVTLDSDGKPTSTVWPGSPNNSTIVNGVTYDSGARPTAVLVSTIGDVTNYTYDSNTGNVTQYKFSQANNVMTGNLNWNSNRTLGSLNISDSFVTSGTQGCAYGYDDVARLISVANSSGNTCGAAQTFSYDQYDNITQAGAFSWNPGYTSSNNEEIGSTYDGAGNVKYDGINTHTWDAYGQMVSANSGNSNAVCPAATTGTCIYYDALGRVVEYVSTVQAQHISHGPAGVTEFFNGSVAGIRIPQPGGGTLFATGTNEQTLYYENPDWQGSSRMVYNISPGFRTYVQDVAYTPYGQTYKNLGSQLTPNFTGDYQDVFSSLYHTHYRDLLQNAGRWRSCDPIHSGWNCYAYPTDPNTHTDPSGLCDENYSSGCSDVNSDEGTNSYGRVWSCDDPNAVQPCTVLPSGNDLLVGDSGTASSSGTGSSTGTPDNSNGVSSMDRLSYTAGLGFGGGFGQGGGFGPFGRGGTDILRSSLDEQLNAENAALRESNAALKEAMSLANKAFNAKSGVTDVTNPAVKAIAKLSQSKPASLDQIREVSKALRAAEADAEAEQWLDRFFSLGRWGGAGGLALNFLFMTGDDQGPAMRSGHSPDVVDLWNWLVNVNTGLPIN